MTSPERKGRRGRLPAALSRRKGRYPALRLESLEDRALLTIGDFLLDIADPGASLQAGSETGFSLAADGDLVAFGSPGEDFAGLSDVGTVHLYDRVAGLVRHSLRNPIPGSGDRFGHAVAVSGNRVVVGNHFDDVGRTDAGTVFIFDAITGDLLHSLNSPTPDEFDYFGFSVGISGNTVVVGAYLDDTEGNDAGSAYLFDATTGALLQTLNKPSPADFDHFGFSVGITGSTVAVAAIQSDDGAIDAGTVYLFDANDGSLLHAITNPTPAGFDYFGHALAIDNDTVVIGSYREDTGAVNAGTAYVYNATTASLNQTLTNPNPNLADNFAFDVAIAGDTVIVGAYRDDAGGTDSGTAYQFNATTGSLKQTHNNPSPANFDYYGAAVAVADDVAIVAAYWDDTVATDAGSAYLFDTNSGTLEETFVTPTLASFDYFGFSVSVSGDRMAVSTRTPG